MKRELLAGLILLAMAGGLYWHNLSHQPEQVRPLGEHEPDFVARAMKTRSYDLNGRLNAEVAADTMRHYQQKQYTEFERPVYLVYPEDSPAIWKVVADNGALQDNRYLSLANNVVITLIEPDKPINTIKTEQLTLDLDTMVMTNEVALQAEGIDFTMTAVGLHADLNQNHIHLKQKVVSTYEVQ
ncbi:LPS export ABC transporter periplasmic protein LptC [Ferrimonas senticii]|uniref:LPS export ABC transporter periplasmic protein LptC n=1 Tax=Ferrimonas senticii TaxID=394566 RepID=UPI0003FD6125|nr:LPS export ABC transporter periplasmic protein LptC [Ferrimonas senticii]